MEQFKILEELLAQTDIDELMFNGHRHLFVERQGLLEAWASPFTSSRVFDDLIAKICQLQNTTSATGLDYDGMLPDGSRFHVTKPPLSPDGPTLTIRKFSAANRGLDNLVGNGFLSQKAARFLEACTLARMNIVISGATSSGKTTLLGALASRIPLNERVITIEDIPEIKLSHSNWVRLLAVREDKGVSVRECLIGCLRMRPDRIIVGECRSSEALEMLQAMNTGHDGSLTTLHANSSNDVLSRLEALVLFHAGAEVPLKALRRQIVDAVDLIVQVRKSPGGRRQVEEIVELVGMEGDVITRSPLFKIAGPKAQEKLMSTGHVPTFLKRIEERGIHLPRDFFDPKSFN
jgi:Flp pilus assembly CpaF family ATPase